MPLPLHPEVSTIPKDGGARSDGHSDAATKPATVRLQTRPAEERGESPCRSSSTAPRWGLGGGQSEAQAAETVAFAGHRRLRCADGEERAMPERSDRREHPLRVSMRARRGSTRVVLPWQRSSSSNSLFSRLFSHVLPPLARRVQPGVG